MTMKHVLLEACLGLLLAAPAAAGLAFMDERDGDDAFNIAAHRQDITIERKLEAYGIRR